MSLLDVETGIFASDFVIRLDNLLDIDVDEVVEWVYMLFNESLNVQKCRN